MNQPKNSTQDNNRPPQNKSKNNHYRNRRKNRPNPNSTSTAATNTPRPQIVNSPLEKLVEKYINLLDQHLIARRKFHDLFYRADNAQLNKLEKNFYNTLYDLRDFEDKQSPEARELLEKRINGLRPDTTYSSNHALNLNETIDTENLVIRDPHLLQSQIKADYKNDKEESMGSIEDYNKYKMI